MVFHVRQHGELNPSHHVGPDATSHRLLTFILYHIVSDLSRGFSKLFSRNFLGEKHLPLWEFTNPSPPDIISIPHLHIEVKHFGKNKKIFFFAKTIDKFCEPWYNSKFGPRRTCADRQFYHIFADLSRGIF